jgi:hypothetical protein
MDSVGFEYVCFEVKKAWGDSMKTVKSGVTLIIIACLVRMPEMQAAEKPKPVSELVKQFGGAKPAQQPKKVEPKPAISTKEQKIIAAAKKQATIPHNHDEKKRKAAQEKMKTLLEQQYGGVVQELTSHPLFTKKQITGAASATGKPQPAPQKPAVARREKEHKVEVEAKTAQAPIHKFKSLKELQDFYKKEMEQQEALLLGIFFDLTGESPELVETGKESMENVLIADWKKQLYQLRTKSTFAQGNNHIMSIYTRPTKKQELFAHEIIKIAKKLFLQEEIGHPEIFFDYVEPTGYAMWVTPFYIQVDMLDVAELPLILNETMLLHEIAHIKYSDAATQTALRETLEKYNPDSLESFMQLWSFFIEKRADVFAWTHGIQYAKGGVDRYESKKHLPVYETTHPSDLNRLALAKQIYQEMLAIPKSK